MRFSKRTAVLAALLVAAVLPSGLVAQPLSDGGHAAVAVHSGGVDFLPKIAYRQAILTVSGNGETQTYTLGSGQLPSIGLFSPSGQLLADGVSRWELQLVPSPATAKRLRAEAAENGGRALEPWTTQSGSFSIRGGVVADPALAEPQQRSAAPRRRGAPSAADLSARGPGGNRLAAEDDDAAVGSRAGVEARVSAAARRQAPAAASSGLVQPNPTAGDRSDAFAATIGRTPEPTAVSDNNQLSAQSRTPRPRSDGSNGRPRSQ